MSPNKGTANLWWKTMWMNYMIALIKTDYRVIIYLKILQLHSTKIIAYIKDHKLVRFTEEKKIKKLLFIIMILFDKFIKL